MDHPDITHIERYGYPRDPWRETTDEDRLIHWEFEEEMEGYDASAEIGQYVKSGT